VVNLPSAFSFSNDNLHRAGALGGVIKHGAARFGDVDDARFGSGEQLREAAVGTENINGSDIAT
jgi:hypothetical protein